jgi:DNA polymerase-3 subunit delta
MPTPAPFHLLTGEDSFRLQKHFSTLKTGFQKKYPQGTIESFSIKSPLSQVLQSILTPSLFTPKRFFVLESFWSKERFEEAQKMKFFEHLAKNTDTAFVLMLEPKIDKRLKFSKFLLKEGKTEAFPQLKEDQIIDWLYRHTNKHGLFMPQNLCAYLVMSCGTDLWTLTKEIEKIDIYLNGAKPTKENIDPLIQKRPQAIIWDFLESVSKKNASRALHHLQSLLAMGESPFQILALLMREARIHMLLHTGLAAGKSKDELKVLTGLHPFVIQKTLPLTKNFTRAQLNTFYDQLYAIDKGIKTGGISTSVDDVSELQQQMEKIVLTLAHKA